MYLNYYFSGAKSHNINFKISQAEGLWTSSNYNLFPYDNIKMILFLLFYYLKYKYNEKLQIKR